MLLVCCLLSCGTATNCQRCLCFENRNTHQDKSCSAIQKPSIKFVLTFGCSTLPVLEEGISQANHRFLVIAYIKPIPLIGWCQQLVNL